MRASQNCGIVGAGFKPARREALRLSISFAEGTLGLRSIYFAAAKSLTIP